MPYVKIEERNTLNKFGTAISAGELNYLITKQLVNYIKTKGRSYQTFNDIIGVLECAKLEIYRRVISHHEDDKRIENGDVYY